MMLIYISVVLFFEQILLQTHKKHNTTQQESQIAQFIGLHNVKSTKYSFTKQMINTLSSAIHNSRSAAARTMCTILQCLPAAAVYAHGVCLCVFVCDILFKYRWDYTWHSA